MTVVPRCAELGGQKGVGLSLSRSKRTFGDTVNTIRATAVQLTNTMPMDASSVVLHVVRYSDTECVTPVGSDDWTWILAIDKKTLLRVAAIRVAGCVCDSQAVLCDVLEYAKTVLY